MKQPSRKQTMTGGVLIFLLILGAYVVGFVGWGSPRASSGSGATTQCNSPASILQCGTVTFTLSATTVNSQAIAFSPAFASTPGSFHLDIPTPAAWPIVSVTPMPVITSYCFICPGAPGVNFAWANMPAALTEIFGDTNREHQIYATSSGPTSSTFRTSVDCAVGSNSATAILRTQWSTDDVNWNDLANTAGQGDLPIDAAVNCPAAGTIISVNNIATSASFPASGSGVYFRIVGVNGGGLGDTPAFEWYDLTIRTSNTSIASACVLDQTVALSATGVTVRLRCFANTSVSATFRWQAQL